MLAQARWRRQQKQREEEDSRKDGTPDMLFMAMTAWCEQMLDYSRTGISLIRDFVVSSQKYQKGHGSVVFIFRAAASEIWS